MIAAAYAALVLPLGDAATICHTSVIFTLVFGRIISKTPITWWKALCTLLLIAGLLLVVKPTILFGGTDSDEDSKKVVFFKNQL